MGNFKWFTAAAIVILVAATYVEWLWVWGVLFVYWAAVSIYSGDAFVVETVERADNALLFWLITAMWGGFGLWYIWADLSWRLV